MPETVLVNGNAYSLLKLLGKGKGGYSYLAQMADGQQVVVKQIHHEPCVYYQFGNKIEAELRDYNHLQEIGIPMPRMLDVDTKAERIVKEYIAGETVYTLVLKDALPETCLRQVQAMCRLLYPAHTNIDYFPTNFILQGDTLYYIDYECNDYMSAAMTRTRPADRTLRFIILLLARWTCPNNRPTYPTQCASAG